MISNLLSIFQKAKKQRKNIEEPPEDAIARIKKEQELLLEAERLGYITRRDDNVL